MIRAAARKALGLREDIRVADEDDPVRTWALPAGKNGLHAGKAAFTWVWCWITLGEQSRVISRARRRE